MLSVLFLLALGDVGRADGQCIDYGDYAHWVGSADTPGEAWDVAIAGNLAYVADRDSGLQVIDITDRITSYNVCYTKLLRPQIR